ncbi:hypothetical protein DFH09DRAFT_1439637 [Mycena vulgaris]|nr:hypothetical protein DFH09DRAFT_1439637 [Mycena vulgaris]
MHPVLPPLPAAEPSMDPPERTTRASVFDTPPVVLFCGAPQPLTAADLDAHHPWRVQMLPIDYKNSQSLPKRQKIARKSLDPPTEAAAKMKSNGCGARVHAGAVPKRGGSMWRGSQKGMADIVLALEDKYIPATMRSVIKSRSEGCGCLRSPVGCAVCGNPLGAFIMHCTVHTYFDSPSFVCEFVPSAVSPPLLPASDSTFASVPPILPTTISPPWTRFPPGYAVVTTHDADLAATRRAVGMSRRPDPLTPGRFIYSDVTQTQHAALLAQTEARIRASEAVLAGARARIREAAARITRLRGQVDRVAAGMRREEEEEDGDPSADEAATAQVLVEGALLQDDAAMLEDSAVMAEEGVALVEEAEAQRMSIVAANQLADMVAANQRAARARASMFPDSAPFYEAPASSTPGLIYPGPVWSAGIRAEVQAEDAEDDFVDPYALDIPGPVTFTVRPYRGMP